MNKTRRDFLKFLGVSSYALTQIGTFGSFSSCASSNQILRSKRFPSLKDDLILHEGLNYYNIISWGDQLNKKQVFGFNNDYITYKALNNDELIMWVNHEYTHPVFCSGFERTKENIDKERELTGGSILKVKKINQKWSFIKDDKVNLGIRGTTKIPFANGVKIKGTNITEGTCSNCAGGYTPWNTFLTCEENPDKNYGDYDRKSGKLKGPSLAQWEKHYPNPIEHYSWVVEIEPETGKAKKHTNLGRFGHESSTVAVSKSNHVVVYSGDDKEDEHVYKFVSESKTDFDKGVLYVANLKKGQWIPLDIEQSPILKKHFKNQLEVLTYCREASKLVGGTPLNRPEDIEVHPHTNDVYIALTKSKKRNDPFGSILKISETNGDHSSKTFTHETFAFGGELSKFSCPDNLAFDNNGNLWMASDISGSKVGKGVYKPFGNNGLFVIPTSGPQAGEVIQVASSPVDAEFTGLSFSPDQKTLFISVQHPGEKTRDLKNPTSTWPTGSMPKPTVVAIEGSLLEQLTQSKG